MTNRKWLPKLAYIHRSQLSWLIVLRKTCCFQFVTQFIVQYVTNWFLLFITSKLLIIQSYKYHAHHELLYGNCLQVSDLYLIIHGNYQLSNGKYILQSTYDTLNTRINHVKNFDMSSNVTGRNDFGILVPGARIGILEMISSHFLLPKM